DALAINGNPLTPSSVVVQRTLPPNSRLEERIDQMFGLTGDQLIMGYIHFETLSNTSGAMGMVEYGTTDGVVLSAVEAQGEGFSDFYFLHVAEDFGYYTGMALVNTNSDPTIVTLDSFNTAGIRQDSTIVNLAPGERQARVLSEIFHRNITQNGGYI